MAAMKYRKLRIAFSGTFGIVAVLLIVLWMRSYSTLDAFHIIKLYSRDANGVQN